MFYELGVFFKDLKNKLAAKKKQAILVLKILINIIYEINPTIMHKVIYIYIFSF